MRPENEALLFGGVIGACVAVVVSTIAFALLAKSGTIVPREPDYDGAYAKAAWQVMQICAEYDQPAKYCLFDAKMAGIRAVPNAR